MRLSEQKSTTKYSSMNTNAGKRIRRLYREQKGNCFYCGRKVKLAYNDLEDKRKATIEHIYPKNDIRRLLFKGSNGPVVLACYGCNQKMNKRFERSIFKDSKGKWEPYLIGILHHPETELNHFNPA